MATLGVRARYIEKATDQQIQLGAPKHLPFEHLQAMNVSFYWSRTPWQGEPNFDCDDVAAEPFGQPLERPERALCGPREPLAMALGAEP